MSKRQTVTIEQLATMISRGFEAVDRQYGELAKAIDTVDGNVDVVRTLTEQVETRLSRIENCFSVLEQSLVGFGVRIEHFIDQDRRISRLEQKVGISGK